MSGEVVLSPAVAAADGLSTLFQTVPDGGRQFWEFFTVNIRNVNTRGAYFKAVETFAAWCADWGLHDLVTVTPMHVAAYVEQLGRTRSPPLNSTSPLSACSSTG